MITKEEIFIRIQQVLIETFEMEEKLIIPEANFVKDLDLDSFDAVDLAVMLEVDTGVKLREEDVRKIQTISDIVDVIHKKMNKIDNFET